MLWDWLRRHWGAFAAWVVSPTAVAAALAAVVGGAWSVIEGLPAPLVAVVAAAALAAVLVVALAALALLDHFAPTRLVHLASDELSRIIDEGQALKESVFGDKKPYFYEVKYWWESAADFVEAVFGPAQRDAFMSPLRVDEWTPFRRGYDDVLEGRCNRLRGLIEKLDASRNPRAMIRVSRRKLKTLGRKQQAQAAHDPMKAALDELTKEAEEWEAELPGARLEFVGHEEAVRVIRATGERGRFFCLTVRNAGSSAATNAWAELTFESGDGEPLFTRSFKGRWADNPLPSDSDRTARVDIPPNNETEPLDVFVFFQEPSGIPGEVYVWDNDNMELGGRSNHHRIEAEHNAFVVRAVIRADQGVELSGAWKIHARIPGSEVEELSP